MHRATLAPRVMTGCHCWLVVIGAIGLVVVLVLAREVGAAVAKECHRETPLPADIRLVAPGPEVPEAMARFAGVWSGAWEDERGEALCHTLVVEAILAHGYTRVIYSLGTSAHRDLRQPTFLHATGRIVDGTLHLHLPVPYRPNLVYRLLGEMLHGTFNDAGSAHLRRVADIGTVSSTCAAARPAMAPIPIAGRCAMGCFR